MQIAFALRNLARNRRRSVLTGLAVGFGVALIFWFLGMSQGSYVQMIDQAVRARLGHVQVLAEGYRREPRPALFLPGAGALVEGLEAVEHVEAVSPRAVSEGMLGRDGETAPVELLGVEPEREARASTASGRLLEGAVAVDFCRERMADALEAMGGDQALFDRWCGAAARSRWLAPGEDRGLVLGFRVAERLLVSVGDEVTVQVVRAAPGLGFEPGDLVQRRLEVVGLLRSGNPEIDDRVAYLPLETLTSMLGTAGPNEVVVLLDDIRHLDRARAAAAALAGELPVAAEAVTWADRSPSLASMIELDAGHARIVFVILCLLIGLGVVNAITMSVLERTRELGVLLALGSRRLRLFGLVMTEVALLGGLAVAGGAAVGLGLELFGRLHGWPLAWFGYSEEMQESSFAGVVYDPIYYSGLSLETGLTVVLGVWLMFLAAGLLPALRASRLRPVAAMRAR